MPFRIEPYLPARKAQVVALSLRAWAPVFRGMAGAVPAFAYHGFYPQGWEARQRSDVTAFLEAEGERVRVATEGEGEGEDVLGWIGLRLHPQDRLGEIHMLAVDPPHQTRGIARALIRRAEEELRQRGMQMVMVETGGDPGHAPARACYQAAGYAPWPVARYVRKL